MNYRISDERVNYESLHTEIIDRFKFYELKQCNKEDCIRLNLNNFEVFKKKHLHLNTKQCELIYTLQLFAMELLKKEKLLIHGVAIVVSNKCYLIIGGPGEGKSTLAELIIQTGECYSFILSDDRTVMGIVNGKVVAWNTPWSKRGVADRENKSYEIKSVIFIKKSNQYKIRQIYEIDAVCSLLRMYPQEISFIVTQIAYKIFKRVKCYTFSNNLISFNVKEFFGVFNE